MNPLIVDNGEFLDDPTAEFNRDAYTKVNTNFENVFPPVFNGTKVREVFRGFNGSTGTLLAQAASSINSGAQFTIPANQLGVVTFISADLSVDTPATINTGYVKHSFIIKTGAGVYGNGGMSLTGASLLELAPVTVGVDSDYFFDLGNIGTATIEDFVNGSGPYAIVGLAVFASVQNGDDKVWLFTGGNGNWGDGATPVTANMFVDLTAQDPIPASGQFLQAITNNDATYTLQPVNLNRATTFTVAVDLTIPDSVFNDENTVRQQAWMSFKEASTIDYPTTDGVSSLEVEAGAFVYAERREIGDEWIVKRVDNISTEAILGTLHNTIIGGVGATINTKALLAAQLTGVSEEDISNFFLVGLDVYAQINKNYTAIGTGIRDTLTKFEDKDARFKANNLNWAANTSVLSFVAPGITAITSGGNALERFDNLTALDLRNLKRITASRVLIGAGSLVSLNLDSLVEIDAGDNLFYNLSGSPIPLLKWNLPSLKSVAVTVSGFRNLNAATNFYAPLLESFTGSNNCLVFGGNLVEFYAPNLKTLDIVSGFTGFASGCVITVHSDLSTANAGEEHAALAAARAAGATIVYHQGSIPQEAGSGTVLRLDNYAGRMGSVFEYNATYTLGSTIVRGGNETRLIRIDTEPEFPEVTGATLVSGSDFEAEKDFEMHVYSLDGVTVDYFFLIKGNA